MKVFVLAALIAFAAARPASSDGEAAAETVAEEYEANPEDGTYKWSYKTSNGIERIESGAQKQITPEDAGMTQQGQWSYQAPDGTEVVFKFTADENGYQPDSALLPVPPPMPAHVVKLLESIARRAKA